ncbi:MAG: hypothetical protein JSW07_21090, partial [bacterium]
MPVHYINRKGQTYYLHHKETKTGRQNYFFSMSKEGKLVEEIPKGYEIYENPNSRVFLRKIKPKIIKDSEKSIVENGLKKFSDLKFYVVDIKGNTISIFTPDQDIDGLIEIMKSGSILPVKSNIEQVLGNVATYSPSMQFVLIDEEKRIFITKRFCYLGSVDDWIEIGEPDKL